MVAMIAALDRVLAQVGKRVPGNCDEAGTSPSVRRAFAWIVGRRKLAGDEAKRIAHERSVELLQLRVLGPN